MDIDMSKFQRINVVATSGSGKSTFARKLAQLLDVEYIEMDALHWKDNWEYRDDKSFFEKINQATAKEKWVLDGNYNKSQEVKWKNVQTLIWLDYSFLLVFFRIVTRSISRLIDHKTMWGTNNTETLSIFLSKENIILWMIESHPRMKKRYNEIFKNNPHNFQLIRLRSPQEAKKFLVTLKHDLG